MNDARGASTMASIGQQIADRLKGVRGGLETARAAIKEVEAEEVSLTKALRALDPEHPMVAQPVKPAPAPVKKKSSKQVGDELTAKVFDAITAAAAPVTVKELNAMVPEVSGSAIGLALRRLRDEDLVRLAGTAPGPGAPQLYARMNGASHG